ncbi:MAG TPA: hypothetical protein VF764_04615 [Steroidobacteraceae bacterium]
MNWCKTMEFGHGPEEEPRMDLTRDETYLLDWIAKADGVGVLSCASAREALEGLVTKGLVVKTPGCGAPDAGWHVAEPEGWVYVTDKGWRVASGG